jgi:hypothetical protein
LPVVLSFACAFASPFASGDHRPVLPPGCEDLNPPVDQFVSFHGYAQGVQIYRWDDPTQTWIFVAPDAALYGDPGFHGQIAIHFAGPTWRTSGSSVREARRPDRT